MLHGQLKHDTAVIANGTLIENYYINGFNVGNMKEYTISYNPGVEYADNSWNGEFWMKIRNIANIDCFHHKSESQHPLTYVKMGWDDYGIALCFWVSDRYMVCRNTELNSAVCRDSCVEFFVKPSSFNGYINFEYNCGGALHCSYIVNNKRINGVFEEYYPIKTENARLIKIVTDQPKTYNDEITQPRIWCLSTSISWMVFNNFESDFQLPTQGTRWAGNFYKCADNSSHPHWASWNAIGDELNFHRPEYFGSLIFG